MSINYVFSEHANIEIIRRKLVLEQIKKVISSPDQILELENSIFVYQSKFLNPKNIEYLLRVFMGTRTDPFTVITAYKTTQFQKYWRNDK